MVSEPVPTLSEKLRGLIEQHVREASPRTILTIASTLCGDEPEIAPFRLISAKPPHFQVRGDVVLDRRTGLMWSRENIAGDRSRKTWTEAKKAVQDCALGGYSDWRLPTIRELLSLVDYERYNPAIDTEVFQCDAAWYWTSTPLVSSSGDCTWGVGFNCGGASWSIQGSLGFVRACRPGQ